MTVTIEISTEDLPVLRQLIHDRLDEVAGKPFWVPGPAKTALENYQRSLKKLRNACIAPLTSENGQGA